MGILKYNDLNVKNELVNSAGEPAVISKKIRNGLIVVISIWQIKDDGAMKSMMSPPLLGLNETPGNLLLPNLLASISDDYNTSAFDKCVLFSNSDSIYTEMSTNDFTSNYLSEFDTIPKFNTINLLDGLSINPPSIMIDNNLYYGSGYLLSEIASRSGGIHFETYKNDWDYIASLSNYALNPLLTEFSIDVEVDDGAGNLVEIREVNQIRNDPNKPLFFIGETNGQSKASFNLSAKFEGIEEPIEKSFEFLFSHDSTKYEVLIPSLLANEKLNDMFNVDNLDTLSIVNLAIEHNLLTNFTALLALEPNDTLHFMEDPFDEGGLTEIVDDAPTNSDSLSVEVYPNPFNNQVKVKLVLIELSNINISIYNILGQKVIDIERNKNVENSYSFIWNGKNSFGMSVATGLYILRVDITGVATNNNEIITKKMLYLK